MGWLLSTPEPFPTALGTAVTGALLLVAVLLSRWLGRRGLPVVLVFLAIGALAGSEGIGGIEFENYGLTFRIGSLALAMILFDGGLNTRMDAVRRSIGPASILATVGVAITAGIVGLAAWLAGMEPMLALLLGAIVSSTDAAAVFSILRGSGISLKEQVGTTLELESGLNDPMAVILTVALTTSLLTGEALGIGLAVDVVLQLGIGAAGGLAIGYAGRWLLQRQIFSGGLYPVLTVAIAMVAFGLPTMALGSGFLAVYLAGLVIGNGQIPYRSNLMRIHDFIAWFSQIIMFLALGLLAFPSQILSTVGMGLVVAVVLALVARPVAVAVCLLPFRYPLKAVAYISWVGLRGAVPIVLATYPVLAGSAAGKELLNVVFFVVVVSALIQGTSVPFVTRLLGLAGRKKPESPAILEISSSQPLAGEVLAFHITTHSAVIDTAIRDMPFPPAAAAMLLVRGRELIAPRGHTVLKDGDHVYVFCRPEDGPLMQLMFGAEEEDSGSSQRKARDVTARG